ncbi:lipocalin family protein [Myroides sp. M-43]|uniref:lipocalin family protein n=1 Tax=Myroides oncorhynchi TaxID=2893756 RepID=UPI001E367675|nr:lipocalin family protein [Myroides oncorhynchi]MCC9044458.1 lipocalin family protein [Myroides oncorhynchi]
MQFKNYTFIIILLILVSCKKEDSFHRPEMDSSETTVAKSIQGNWTEFIPFNKEKPKSFTLKESGDASSINVINKQYTHWWVNSHQLCVLAESDTNKRDTLFFSLKAVSDKVIVLEHNNQEYTYKRIE